MSIATLPTTTHIWPQQFHNITKSAHSAEDVPLWKQASLYMAQVSLFLEQVRFLGQGLRHYRAQNGVLWRRYPSQNRTCAIWTDTCTKTMGA